MIFCQTRFVPLADSQLTRFLRRRRSASGSVQLSVEQIQRLLAGKGRGATRSCLEEICFIGLVSYFEAFCRDCFASLINICQTALLSDLPSKDYNISIDP